MTDEEAAELTRERDALKAHKEELLRETKVAKDAAKKAADALKNYDGLDVDEFRALKAASVEAEQKKAAAEGDFNKLKQQLVDAHAKDKKTLVDAHSTELGERDGKIAKMNKALERRLIDAELTKAIAAKKGDAEMLIPYARQFVKVRELEDDFEGYVVDERGQPRIADGKGTAMGFEQFVELTLMPKFPRAFDGTGSSGGGAAKSIASGGGAKTIAANDGAAFLQQVDGISKGSITVTTL